MDRGRITSFASIFAPVAIGLAAGFAVQGCGIAASAHAAVTGSTSTVQTTTTALTASVAGPKFVLLGCNNEAEVAPSSITNCGDGAAGLSGLHWTSWTSHLASGYGTYYLNDCTPTCVGGHFHAYPALATLWGSAAVAGHPSERKYTQLTLIFTGKRPPAYSQVNGKTVVTHPVTLTLPTFP
jgi:hypothetical protein